MIRPYIPSYTPSVTFGDTSLIEGGKQTRAGRQRAYGLYYINFSYVLYVL